MATKSLEHWVEKLSRQSLPILGDVVRELNKITGSEETEANQMAEVILRDAKMTSHVLKVANSVQYNYSKTEITTVSRAVVLIGLKGMRAICISLMVMDSLLKNKPKERVLELMAQGFHAATQARNLVKKVDEKSAEEAFIAALLFNLGEMAFWASEDVDQSNEGLISDNPKVRKQAMNDILGGSFKSITLSLSKQWKLGDTLEEALNPGENPSSKARAVITGERLSRAALFGWESPQVKKVLGEVAEFHQVDLTQALKLVKEGADQASEAALKYGVAEACPLIPNSLSDFVREETKPASKVMKGDAKLQLNILRELSNATRDRIDVNTIFQMVLEGMHRGIGLERVCIAFIQGHKIKAKYVLGESIDHWRTSFVFDIGPYSESIFTHAISGDDAHWFTTDQVANSAHLYPDDVVRIVGKVPAFVSVLQVDQRKVGLFYADRWTYGGQLDEEKFDSFKHFASQAQINLNIISNKKRF